MQINFLEKSFSLLLLQKTKSFAKIKCPHTPYETYHMNVLGPLVHLVQFDVRCSAHKVPVRCHLSEPAGPKANPAAGGKYK